MIYRVHKLSYGGYVLVIVFSSLQDGIDSVLFQYILTLFMQSQQKFMVHFVYFALLSFDLNVG
jgi:hypothetical protein